MTEERLQKLISQAGIASRRAAENLIRQGRVRVNGKVAQLGDKADLEHDKVQVDDVTLKAKVDYVYYLLYKPVNVLSTNRRFPNEKRKLVRDLIPYEGHLFTVGRLDADSEGLIILTNDGELADLMTHPRYGHTKTYHVLVDGHPTPKNLDQWRQGVMLEEKMTAPAKVKVLSETNQDTWIQIVMREGRKRQIRNVAEILGYRVKRLIRVKIDTIDVGHMHPGEFRTLSPAEIQQLKRQHRTE